MQKFRVPPVPPRKTPLKKQPQKTSNPEASISIVSEYDKLCQKAETFHSSETEEKMLAFVKNALKLRQKMLMSEAEVQRVSKLLVDKDKELLSKDQKFKQAREMVDLEMRGRQKAEQQVDELHKQWATVGNLVNSGGGSGLNNDTLQRIRSSVSSSILNTPIGRGKTQRDPMIPEYSQESILDASELFEDSVEEINNEDSRIRRSSRNKSVVSKTTVTADPNGHVHATTVLESVDLPEKVHF